MTKYQKWHLQKKSQTIFLNSPFDYYRYKYIQYTPTAKLNTFLQSYTIEYKRQKLKTNTKYLETIIILRSECQTLILNTTNV